MLNEAENLPLVLPKIPDWVDEIVLVDGGSIDGSKAVARSVEPRVRVVTQAGKGKGAALRTGFEYAEGDIIVMLDADGSMDPKEIPAFVGCLGAGADFVKGSRFLQGGGTADMPVHRKLGNWTFVVLVRLLFGGRYSDLCYGYNAFWARVLPRLGLTGTGFEIETIMNIRALRAGLKVVEVPSYEDKRKYGEGRLRTIPDGWRVLRAIVREYASARRVAARERAAATARRHAGGSRSKALRDVAETTSEVTGTQTVSVVICSYSDERWDQLAAAVESVRPQLGPGDELIVSVDHNRPLSLRARRRWPDVRVVESQEPRGLSGGRNAGVKAAGGAVIAFVDDDAVPARDWLQQLRGRYVDPSVVAVGGAVEPAWEQGKPRWLPEEFAWVVGCTLHVMPERAAPVRNVIGANMSFRREVLQDVGLFRSGIGRVGSLPEGCEETEVCIRARQRWPGRMILFDPEVRVVHHVPAHRATWRYLVRRCYREGISKASLSERVGARAGLSAERAYVGRTLPRAAGRALVDACLRRDPSGLARAGAIAAGVAAATSGYLVGRLSGLASRQPDPLPAAEPSGT